MKNQTDSERVGTPAVAVKRAVTPQPGEIWKHYRHGRVRIIRPWNDRECICELLDAGYWEKMRRAILMNELMEKVEGLGTKI